MTPDPSSASTGGHRPRRGLALVALCMAFFVVQLDVTVVNVALETVGRALGGGVGARQWIVASYTAALAAGMLTAGSLGDRVGARRLCTLGLGVFAVGSAACSFAPSMGVLIAARTLQGVGAAPLLPCSLALIVAQFPDAGQRARALGVWGAIGGVGMATGPVVGGTLIALADWRAIFLLNVPFCVITAALIHLSVREASRQRHNHLDGTGLVLGTIALGALTGGLIEAGHRGWGDPFSLGLLAAAVVAGALFVVVERRCAEPMLPPTMFRSRPFTGATAAGGIFNLCLYGTLLVVSLFLQGALGESPLYTGLLLMPLTVAVGIGATLSGRLTARFGARRPMFAGYVLGAVGAVVLAFAASTGPVWLIVAGSVVLGFCSVAMPAMTSLAMSGVPADRTGLGSGVLNTSRQAGGALGAAVLGSLLTAGGPMSLLAPMIAAALAYVLAIVATAYATSRRHGSGEEPSLDEEPRSQEPETEGPQPSALEPEREDVLAR